MKRLFSVLIILALLLFAVSCSEKDGAVLSVGKLKIDKGMYTYLTATYKASFLETYNKGFDTQDFWKTEVETENGTVTYQSYIEDYILDNISRTLVSAKLFDDKGLTLSDKANEEIDNEIGDLLKTQSEQELNEALSQYSIDRDTLRKIKVLQTKSEAYYSYMYENEGEKAPDVSDLNDYLKENYRAIGFVTIYTKKAPVLDKNGDYTYDENGDIAMKELSEKEVDVKKAIEKNVISSLENGATYDEVKEFSDEDYSSFEKGMLICKSDVNSYGKDIVTCAMNLSEGEYARAEKDGTVYIMVCLKTPLYTELSSNYTLTDIYSNCTTDKYFSDIDKIVESDVTLNEKLLKEIDIVSIKQNKNY